MSRFVQLISGAALLGLLALQAQAAEVTLNAARVGATDVAALARFYESALGLKEVNRFQFPNMLEILMNFGDSVDAAKSNTAAQIVIMQRASNDTKDPIPHLIFNVTDVMATAAAIKAAGGTMDGDPKPFGKTGIMIGMAIDPAGNRLELIQRPRT